MYIEPEMIQFSPISYSFVMDATLSIIAQKAYNKGSFVQNI